MLNIAFAIHYAINMDSELITTREFWRQKAGFPEHVIKDPRPMKVIVAEFFKESTK